MKMKTLLGLVVGAVLAVSAGTVWALPDLVPGANGSTAQWSVSILPRTKPCDRIYSMHRI